jgi:muramidase (phage lysozyme)
MSTRRQQLEAWAKANPGLYSGLQQAIAGAEGTILGGKPGYNVMFGGGKFKDFSRHPDKVISSPGGYSSAAAGAYQFLPGTFAGAQKRLGLRDFSPESQILAMLDLVKSRLDPIGGLAAITKAGTLTPQIQEALAPEWASFPTASGKSYYGQPVKKPEQIQKFFEQGMRSSAPPPPPLPTETAVSAPRETGNALGSGLLRAVMGVIPQLQRRRSFLPEVQQVNYPGLGTGADTFASSYLEDIARQMMEEV